MHARPTFGRFPASPCTLVVGRKVHGRPHFVGTRVPNVAIVLVDFGLDGVRVEPLLAEPDGHFMIRVGKAQEDVLRGQNEGSGVIEEPPTGGGQRDLDASRKAADRDSAFRAGLRQGIRAAPGGEPGLAAGQRGPTPGDRRGVDRVPGEDHGCPAFRFCQQSQQDRWGFQLCGAVQDGPSGSFAHRPFSGGSEVQFHTANLAQSGPIRKPLEGKHL